jgi:hypothetical protein
MPLEASPVPFHPVKNPTGYCREHDVFCCRRHEGEAMNDNPDIGDVVPPTSGTEAQRPATLGIPPAKEGPLKVVQFNPRGAGGTYLFDAVREIMCGCGRDLLLDEGQRGRLSALEEAAAHFVVALANCTPPGPERSTAISRAREAKMWGSAAIALEPKE